jgi:hypothetical protein
MLKIEMYFYANLLIASSLLTLRIVATKYTLSTQKIRNITAAGIKSQMFTTATTTMIPSSDSPICKGTGNGNTMKRTGHGRLLTHNTTSTLLDVI